MKKNSFETELSDPYHMIYTILKTKFEKFEPKKLICRNFKQFDNDQTKFNICNSMSAVRTQASFGNNFVSIQVNMLLRNMMLLEKDKLLSKQKDVASTSINILGQLQTRYISLVGPKRLQCHQETTQLTPLLKKFPFIQVKKQEKISSKLKANFRLRQLAWLI